MIVKFFFIFFEIHYIDIKITFIYVFLVELFYFFVLVLFEHLSLECDCPQVKLCLFRDTDSSFVTVSTKIIFTRLTTIIIFFIILQIMSISSRFTIRYIFIIIPRSTLPSVINVFLESIPY